MMEIELIEKVAHLEEREKSNSKRIDKCELKQEEHDKKIEELSNVYIALTKVDNKVTNVENDVSEIKKDLKDIKEKPVKNWDNLKWLIITRNCNCNSGFFVRKNRIIGKEVK